MTKVFNMEAFRSKAGRGDHAGAVAPTTRYTKEHFVFVPRTWIEALDVIPSQHAHRVLLRLLLRSWERKTATVKASNELFRGMRRNSKMRVLRLLEAAGLLLVEPGGGKRSPLVTILYPSHSPAARHMRHGPVP
jgi:hypothetical protein